MAPRGANACRCLVHEEPVSRAWRLLVTEPTDGATNMAVDEAVWRGRQAGTSPPTVRFFAWQPPTVSLGYGQALGGGVDVVAGYRRGVGRPAGPARAPTPAFCFARSGSYELEINGRKVVGSAQRRQGACFLQHGSILLGVDVPRLRAGVPPTR